MCESTSLFLQPVQGGMHRTYFSLAAGLCFDRFCNWRPVGIITKLRHYQQYDLLKFS